MDWWTLRLKKIYAFKIILGNCINVFTQCEEQQTWLIHPRLECLVCAALEAVPNMLGGAMDRGRDWIHGHQPPSSRGNLILIQSEGWQHHASTQGQCSPHCMTSGSQSKDSSFGHDSTRHSPGQCYGLSNFSRPVLACLMNISGADFITFNYESGGDTNLVHIF